MLVIVGAIIVIGSVLGGFAMAGGSVHSLIHPSELVTIGGAATGALVIMCPMKVIKDLLKGVLATFKGTPYKKTAYEELFKAMYELLKLARYNGLLALEPHLANPHESSIFSKYPTIIKNHHAEQFICSSLTLVVDGSVTPEQLPELMGTELKAMEEEHHAPISVLSKTADGLPGFGIVAAVLGIVITMGAIDGPVEEIGHKVGAALVGTFLGILLSYGFIAPLVVQMEFLGHAEMAYFRCITSIVVGFTGKSAPKIVIEQARRGVSSEFRPDAAQLEAALRELG
jgi:chemotaxis protein MotA